jgi:hypothetical protein
MPWVEKRIAAGGKPRYVALYRDPTGAKRSAGTYPSKVLATRAAYDAARTIKHSTPHAAQHRRHRTRHASPRPRPIARSTATMF